MVFKFYSPRLNEHSLQRQPLTTVCQEIIQVGLPYCFWEVGHKAPHLTAELSNVGFRIIRLFSKHRIKFSNQESIL